MNFEDDFRMAINARDRALPGSCGYKVGSILHTKSGKKYPGCNIDNHDIQSICAERVSFVKALSEGEYEFDKIIVIGGKGDKLERCLPCGYCRQFMSQFVNPKEFKVYTIYDGKAEEYALEELLPYGFTFDPNKKN